MDVKNIVGIIFIKSVIFLKWRFDIVAYFKLNYIYIFSIGYILYKIKFKITFTSFIC